MSFNECNTCGHSSYEHVHPTVKNISKNCFHKDGWDITCKCRKFVKIA